MSSNVVWNIVRKSSAYRVKRNGVEFSSEPGNLTNKNTYKWSGLAQAKTVDISAVNGNPTMTVTIPKRSNTPAKSRYTVRLTKGKLGRRSNNVKRIVARSYFRRDLEKAALARLTRLHIARTRPGGVEKTPRARRA